MISRGAVDLIFGCLSKISEDYEAIQEFSNALGNYSACSEEFVHPFLAERRLEEILEILERENRPEIVVNLLRMFMNLS